MPIDLSKIPAVIKRLAAEVSGDPLAWRIGDVEIVIAFADGRKLKFDAQPPAGGKHIEIQPPPANLNPDAQPLATPEKSPRKK